MKSEGNDTNVVPQYVHMNETYRYKGSIISDKLWTVWINKD